MRGDGIAGRRDRTIGPMAAQSTRRRSGLARLVSLALAGALAVLAGACGSTGDGDERGAEADPTPASTTANGAVSPDDSGASTGENAEGTGHTPSEHSRIDTSDRTGNAADPAAPTVPPTTPPIEPTPTPTPTPRPPAPNGRIAPRVAATATELAEQVAAAETGLLDPASTGLERADWGHLHQVAIRKLGYEPGWDVDFFETLPQEYRARTLLHISARRALIDLSSGYSAADFIPAWEIVEPEPADALLSYYEEAEAATGIDWEYLAAINLIETGMGRIRGLSSAGAQGPMQFLPTTWAEAGIGEGDIENPRDAINAAARYLVRRGGPNDMAGAIWGYNNSDDYVTAVLAYAELLRQDPAAYQAIYNWEIYFYTEAGDVWLPTGLRNDERTDLVDYLAANPWSAPDPGLR